MGRYKCRLPTLYDALLYASRLLLRQIGQTLPSTRTSRLGAPLVLAGLISPSTMERPARHGWVRIGSSSTSSLTGKIPAFAPHREIGVDELIATRMTWSRSAVRNAYLCLLATRNPLHLLNNSPLDLVNEISDFTSAERHQHLPQEFLSGHGPAGLRCMPSPTSASCLRSSIEQSSTRRRPPMWPSSERQIPISKNAVHTHCATVREQRDLTGRAAAQLTRCPSETDGLHRRRLVRRA